MGTKQRLDITTPVGRMVGGSLYEPKSTDGEGKPLVVKTGPNAGKPRVEYSFAIAIPKNPGETHWSQHPFFAKIWQFGHSVFPNGEAQHPAFSWKITDGDSTIPNKKLKKPCDQEGYPGNWVVWFSGGVAPRVFNHNGTQQIVEPNAVKPGYYIQVFGSVTDNKPSQTPGLYMNHSMIALSGVGPEISFGPDVSQAGFGQGVQLPPGATAYTGQPVPPAGAIPATGAPPAPVPPLIPNVAPPAPMVPAMVPSAPARQMTAKANGATYEALIGAGWTDAMLIEHGMMLAPAPVAMVPPPLPVGSVPMPAVPAPTAVAPPPLPTTPNPAILAVPGAPVAAPPAPARQMTAKANGATYEALIGAGWTDALLVQHGMMAA